MNSYDRYIRTLKGEKPDFLPRLPILMGFAAQFIGSNYGAFASDYRVLVEANLRCAEFFEFDQVSVISDPYRETQGFGAEIQYVTDGVPRCVRSPLENSKDPTRLAKPDPMTSTRMHDRVQAVEAYSRAVRHQYSILGWVEGPAAEAADLRGVTNFLMDLIEDPDFSSRLMDVCVDAGVAFARAQLQAGADTIGIGDAIASQVSPDLYEEFIFPREKILVDAIHNEGGFVRLHICGNTTHLLPWIAKLNVDILDLDWQVTMAEARKVVGPKTTLMGNLDPANDVLRGSPQAIREKIMQIYRTVGAPYMVGAGCEIPIGTPNENLRALCAPVHVE